MEFMDKAEELIKQLIEDQAVIDVANDKDFMNELEQNGYTTQDASIKYLEDPDNNRIIVKVPFVYGGPDETRLSENNIIIFKDDTDKLIVTATELSPEDIDYPYTDEDAKAYIEAENTEWFDINDKEGLEDYMMSIGM